MNIHLLLPSRHITYRFLKNIIFSITQFSIYQNKVYEKKAIFWLGFHFISVRPNPLDNDKPVMTALGFLGRLPGGKF